MNLPFYFDYNSTAPLANSLKDYLAKGVFFEANASSVHNQGKKALKQINFTKNFIAELYELEKHDLVFTSGATEGLNWIVRDFIDQNVKNSKPFAYICFTTDHSVALKQKELVNIYGGIFHSVEVLESGQVNQKSLEEKLTELKDHSVLINWTWVNNETGSVWDLKKIADIKKRFSCLVHVDAAQTPFKIENYNEIHHDLDFYSFSGHKFGALKGVGFSFIHKSLNTTSLFLGGDQQKLRSGTLNTLGIFSLELALKENITNFNPEKALSGINFLRKSLSRFGVVIGSENLNLNTINLGLKNTKAQVALIKFDLGKISISSGSACTSGNLKPSHVVLAMGFDDLAENALRFSFEPDLNLDKANVYFEIISKVLTSLEG